MAPPEVAVGDPFTINAHREPREVQTVAGVHDGGLITYRPVGGLYIGLRPALLSIRLDDVTVLRPPAEPELVDPLAVEASRMRAWHQALVAEGFTDDQACRLLEGMNSADFPGVNYERTGEDVPWAVLDEVAWSAIETPRQRGVTVEDAGSDDHPIEVGDFVAFTNSVAGYTHFGVVVEPAGRQFKVMRLVDATGTEQVAHPGQSVKGSIWHASPKNLRIASIDEVMSR